MKSSLKMMAAGLVLAIGLSGAAFGQDFDHHGRDDHRVENRDWHRDRDWRRDRDRDRDRDYRYSYGWYGNRPVHNGYYYGQPVYNGYYNPYYVNPYYRNYGYYPYYRR